MATAEWESYALSGRFKTKRRRTRLRKKAEDKQLVHKYRELRAVQKAQRKLGLTELKPPVQKGWIRSFVLRPDLARSKDAPFFLALLEKINTQMFSLRKDFARKRRRSGKKVFVERIQKLHEFYEWDRTIKKLTEKERSFFREEIVFLGNTTRTTVKRVFTEPWRYVLRVRPNMITHTRNIDATLMSRERELDNFFDRNAHYPRLNKLLDGYYKYRSRWDTQNSLRLRLKKELYDELKTIED